MFCNDINFLFTNSANCKTEIDNGKPLKFVKIYVYSKIGEFCMFFFFMEFSERVGFIIMVG